MPPDERGYLIVPHEIATGADCDGWLVVKARGKVADLVCNSCGGVVDTVPIRCTGTRLMELASVEICSALCPRCGATNMFRGFTVIETFICRECGEGVKVEWPVQLFDSSKQMVLTLQSKLNRIPLEIEEKLVS